ncbi:MAG: hypothetical protein WAM88_01815 [Nitrososphaeraceae archaeon]
MKQSNSNSDAFYREIIKKSLFTDRQISIIYKRVKSHSAVENISPGAYYRQLKQCRLKIKATLYSILLLRLCGALDNQAMVALERITTQLDVMSQASEPRDFSGDRMDQDVALLVQKLVDTMCKV